MKYSLITMEIPREILVGLILRTALVAWPIFSRIRASIDSALLSVVLGLYEPVFAQ